jgi:hypothetical protein
LIEAQLALPAPTLDTSEAIETTEATVTTETDPVQVPSGSQP